MAQAQQSKRSYLIEEIKIRLGAGIIDIELDPKHYNYAVTSSIQRYRQTSSNALEQSFLFMDVQPDQSVYTLPNEVQEVISILRRTIGGTAGGASVDPFSLAFVNNIYMIQNPGGLGTTGAGMMATYDMAMQFQNVAGRLFGRDVMFTWDASTKRINLQRRFTAVEQIALEVFNTRPEESLLGDPYALPWVRDYAIAVCKLILGEARSKFGSIGGPQGGVTLNGDALKNEAKEEMLRLDKEVADHLDQRYGQPLVIG
jgi:hypothetical protein